MCGFFPPKVGLLIPDTREIGWYPDSVQALCTLGDQHYTVLLVAFTKPGYSLGRECDHSKLAVFLTSHLLGWMNTRHSTHNKSITNSQTSQPFRYLSFAGSGTLREAERAPLSKSAPLQASVGKARRADNHHPQSRFLAHHNPRSTGRPHPSHQFPPPLPVSTPTPVIKLTLGPALDSIFSSRSPRKSPFDRPVTGHFRVSPSPGTKIEGLLAFFFCAKEPQARRSSTVTSGLGS